MLASASTPHLPSLQRQQQSYYHDGAPPRQPGGHVPPLRTRGSGNLRTGNGNDSVRLSGPQLAVLEYGERWRLPAEQQQQQQQQQRLPPRLPVMAPLIKTVSYDEQRFPRPPAAPASSPQQPPENCVSVFEDDSDEEEAVGFAARIARRFRSSSTDKAVATASSASTTSLGQVHSHSEPSPAPGSSDNHQEHQHHQSPSPYARDAAQQRDAKVPLLGRLLGRTAK